MEDIDNKIPNCENEEQIEEQPVPTSSLVEDKKCGFYPTSTGL